jgi:hypothetical protein
MTNLSKSMQQQSFFGSPQLSKIKDTADDIKLYEESVTPKSFKVFDR